MHEYNYSFIQFVSYVDVATNLLKHLSNTWTYALIKSLHKI